VAAEERRAAATGFLVHNGPFISMAAFKPGPGWRGMARDGGSDFAGMAGQSLYFVSACVSIARLVA
jgi:hypothetical protein